MFIPFLKKERECTYLFDLGNKKFHRFLSALLCRKALLLLHLKICLLLNQVKQVTSTDETLYCKGFGILHSYLPAKVDSPVTDVIEKLR